MVHIPLQLTTTGETNHDLDVGVGGGGLNDRTRLLDIDRDGLLEEDVLAGGNGPDGEVGVGAGLRGDEDSVNVGRVEHHVGVGDQEGGRGKLGLGGVEGSLLGVDDGDELGAGGLVRDLWGLAVALEWSNKTHVAGVTKTHASNTKHGDAELGGLGSGDGGDGHCRG